MAGSDTQLSNPFSTGGGGHDFEIRVQAAFTVLLLTGGNAPCLPPYSINMLKLQGRYDGYDFDDFVAFVSNPESGREIKLMAQIKHKISITTGDSTFSDVMHSAWLNFNSSKFDANSDKLAIITGPLTSVDTQHVRPLFEWARHSANETEFFEKVKKDDFSSEEKRKKLQVIQDHLNIANGSIISNQVVWEFLKCFYFIGYDLDVEGGSTYALLLSLIRQYSSQPPEQVFSTIVDAISMANHNAGTITRETFNQAIVKQFDQQGHTHWQSDVELLKKHGRYVLDNIQSKIENCHIERKEDLNRLQALMESANFIWVTGQRGAGKSSLIRTMISNLEDHAPTFCLRTEDLNHSSLSQVFTALGVKGGIHNLETAFALMPKKYLFIESLEKLLELDHQTGFEDLLSFLKKNPSWTVVATGRDYAYQLICFNFFLPKDITPASLDLHGFTALEVEQLCQKVKGLQAFMVIPELKSLLQNPFFASLAYRVVYAGATFSSDATMKEFRNAVWRDVISKEIERSNGMPSKRKETFIQIALQRAKQMVYSVSGHQFDQATIDKLQADDLIQRDTESQRLSPAHDVFEDWALEEFIERAYIENQHSILLFLRAVGDEPAMNRAFRLWLQRKFQEDNVIVQWVLRLVKDTTVEKYWQDEALAAVLQSNSATSFLTQLETECFENDCDLLKRLCFILRVTCKAPSSSMPSNLNLLEPFGIGWEALILFLWDRKETIPIGFNPHILEVLSDWSMILSVNTPDPKLARTVGLFAFHLLKYQKDRYRRNKTVEKLLEVVFRTSNSISDEITALVEQSFFADAKSKNYPNYMDDFSEMALSIPYTAFFCNSHPELVMRLALHMWISEPENDPYHSRSSDISNNFGLEDIHYFFPASGSKGPFHPLLWGTGYKDKGLDFILQLLNNSVEHYVKSISSRHQMRSIDGDFCEIKLVLGDGTEITQFASTFFWLGYRGFSTVPYLLQSALMALENWLIMCVKNFDSQVIENIFEYIIRNSNSVMTTAVLGSIATGFPQKVGRLALPLLSHPILYSFDRQRMLHERTENVDWHASSSDIFSTFFSQERRKAASYSWRKEDLEFLVTRLQVEFPELREEVFKTIDIIRSASTGIASERFLLHRIDSRDWDLQPIPEKNQIRILPPKLEPDLENIQREMQQEIQQTSQKFKLKFWADRVFNTEPVGEYAYSHWRIALNEAQALYAENQSVTAEMNQWLEIGTPIKVAACVLRDYRDEMTPDESKWCVDVVLNKILLSENDSESNFDGGDFDGFLAAAFILPILLGLTDSENEKTVIKKHILFALTHSHSGVRTGIADGIRHFLWDFDPDFAHQCFWSAIRYSQVWRENYPRLRRSYLYDTELDNNWNQIRERFCNEAFQNKQSLESINISVEKFSIRHLLNATRLIPVGSRAGSHTEIFMQLLQIIFTLEDSEPNYFYGSDALFHYKELDEFRSQLTKHIIALSDDNFEPYTEILHLGCEKAPQFLYRLILDIAVSTEKPYRKDIFWKFWEMLFEKMKEISLNTANIDDIDSFRSEARKLVRGFCFLGGSWQKVDYENEHIALGKSLLLRFTTEAGINPHVFEGLASLMHYFPHIFFENGVHILAKWKQLPSAKLISSNCTFYLENSIHRYLFQDHLGLISKQMYESCLTLLTCAVETASARAYFLRERLIRSRRVKVS